MKHGFLLLIIFLSCSLVRAQSIEKKSLQEFNSGMVSEFFSEGKGKSQGLKLHFKYPQSWESLKGNRPHVIRKFAQPHDYVLAMILVNKFDYILPQEEVNTFMTQKGLKTIVPKSGEFISSNNDLKIEGLNAASIEYTNKGARAGRNFYSRNVNYVFIYKEYFVSIQFIVLDNKGESKASVANRFKNAKPLFKQMFNSIVIDNVWE